MRYIVGRAPVYFSRSEIGQQIFFAGMWRSANSVKRVAASRVAYTARPTKGREERAAANRTCHTIFIPHTHTT